MEAIKRHKVLVIIIAVLLLLAYILNSIIGGKMLFGGLAVRAYDKVYGVTPFAERGNVKEETNYFYEKNMFIFTSVSSVLVAEYSENDFREQKEFLESREQIDRNIGENWSKEPFSIGGWTFIVDAESEPPKNLMIFGFNEIKHKIAYIKFNDMDLDSIDETPKTFFNRYIKYRF